MTLSTIGTNSIADDAVTAAKATGFGKVGQVVTATHATQVNSTSTSFADSGLTCNITPSATTSKILVIVQQQLISDRDQSDCYSRLRLLRESTSLMEFNKAQWDEAGDEGATKSGSLNSLSILDSPSSSSQITYHTEFAAGQTSNNGTSRCQHNNETSTMILMEILA